MTTFLKLKTMFINISKIKRIVEQSNMFTIFMENGSRPDEEICIVYENTANSDYALLKERILTLECSHYAFALQADTCMTPQGKPKYIERENEKIKYRRERDNKDIERLQSQYIDPSAPFL
jgi:hypothetical protein